MLDGLYRSGHGCFKLGGRSWIAAEGLDERAAWVSVGRHEHDGQAFWVLVLDSRESSPSPRSRASITAAVMVAWSNANVVRAALDSRGAHPEIDQAWSTYFDRAVERCTLPIERERAAGLAPSTGPSAHALARALMHMTLHSIDELLRAGASATEAQDLIETLTVLWARGVGNEPG